MNKDFRRVGFQLAFGGTLGVFSAGLLLSIVEKALNKLTEATKKDEEANFEPEDTKTEDK